MRGSDLASRFISQLNKLNCGKRHEYGLVLCLKALIAQLLIKAGLEAAGESGAEGAGVQENDGRRRPEAMRSGLLRAEWIASKTTWNEMAVQQLSTYRLRIYYSAVLYS